MRQGFLREITYFDCTTAGRNRNPQFLYRRSLMGNSIVRRVRITSVISLTLNAAEQRSVIFEAYSKIGLALSQDQLSEAIKHAKELQSAIAATDHKKARNEMLPSVDALTKAKDLAAARKSYELLSSKLSPLRKDLGIPAEEYYCPMLKKTWLQKDSKIVNPYAGKDMAGCGENKKSS
jgi:hypothetical protein